MVKQEQSTASAALGQLYQEWVSRMAASPAMDLQSIRDMYERWESVSAEPENVSYKTVDIDGIPAIWAIPHDAATDRAMIYAHGGGYLAGSSASHRKLVGHIAKASQTPALAYDYRLAPEHVYPAQLDDSQTVFDWVVSEGIRPSRIALAGDSAGGALVTMLALKIRDSGGEQPGAVVALSPFYDLDAAGSTMELNADFDILCSKESMVASGAMLLGDNRSSDNAQYVRVLEEDLSGLPPFFVSAGSSEMLLDDSRRFVNKARKSGVEAELEVVDNMQHVFHLMAGKAPEPDSSISAIGTFLKSQLGAA